MGAFPISDAGASAAGSARLGLWLTTLLATPVAILFVCAAFSPATLAVSLSAGKPATICFLNFPLLVLAIYWRGLTTWGAVLGGSTGLVASIGLTILGPPVWVRVLGHAMPVFPLDPPTLVAMPLAFAVCIGVSALDRSRRAVLDRAGYAEQSRRMTGCTALAAAE